MPGWPYFIHCTKCHTIKIHLTKQVVLTDIKGSTLIVFFSIPLKLYFVFYFSRTIVFHPEGNALFSGSHDMLKIHQWEPGPRVCDAVSMGWGKIRDMAVSASQLVRCNSNFQKWLKFENREIHLKRNRISPWIRKGSITSAKPWLLPKGLLFHELLF